MSLESALLTIFNEALEHEDPAARSRYLEGACGTDAELRKRVERLLQAHSDAGKFLSQSKPAAFDGARSADRGGVVEEAGQQVGRYKLLQQIGEGGCGLVYMAEQQEPVRRRVAVKIIKLGMDTRSVIARFEAERQALAMMDHPNIARVLDAGATETGRPYFVMELVRGVKLTDYCDQKEVSTEERLNLFIQVCKAVQHAHTKGIIHRDLKPSNILVTMHDGVPVPKVIDFGIAKATGQQRLTDKTLFTAFEQFLGTPVYMSPEQAEMSGLDIDTRSDIYSLGVLLYELLVGKPPFDNQELLTAGFDEMRRIIREKEPERPSTRLARSSRTPQGREGNGTLNNNDSSEKSESRHLACCESKIDPDLDWVVMKCLEKDRTRRYQTANGLAMDLERHLRSEPVTARPATRLYQFQKLVRRNKMTFAAAGAIAAALAIGTGLSTWLYIRERAALRTAAESAKSEARERLRAEHALTGQQFETAELLFAQNDSAKALAYLARLLRQQPANQVVAQRIVSALTHRNSCVPSAPPFVHGRPLKSSKDWAASDPKHPLITGPSIRSAQFSPDGELVLTGSRDGTAVVWNTRTGKSHLTLRHVDEVFWAEFSPDGERIVTACRDHQAYIWSVADGQLLTPLAHEGAVTHAEFSPDGERVVTASEDSTAKVWSVRTGQLLAGPLRHSDTVVTAQFSRDGRRIVTASYDNFARVWNSQTGEPRSPPLKGGLFFAKFSPDGEKVIAGGYEGIVRIWSASGTSIVSSSAHQATIQSADFSPDGNLAITAGSDNKVRFWDVTGDKELPHYIQHNGAVLSSAISRDGRVVATGSGDTTARLSDARTALPLSEPINHERAVHIVALSRTGRHLLTVSDDRAFLWEVRPFYSTALELRHGNSALGSGRFSPDGNLVFTAGHEGGGKLWRSKNGRMASSGFFHGRSIFYAEFSADGKVLATTSRDGIVKIWNAHSTALHCVLKHSGWVRTVKFSPIGQLVLTASYDGTARLWRIPSGELLTIVEPGKVSMAAFAPDGQHFITASFNNTVQVWDASGARVGQPLIHENGVNSVDYSGDGSKIVTASKDKTARIWNSESGEPLVTLLHDDDVRSAVFNRDGTLVLTCSGNSARLWDARTGDPSRYLVWHNARVNSARFSPDGRYVVTSSDDGSARVWDAATGHAVSEPLRHDGAVRYAEFSPDGKWILSIDKTGLAKVWEATSFDDSIPPWLPELAEAFAGQRLNAKNGFEHVEPADLWRLKESLVRSGATDAYTRWAKWLFADQATRKVSPSAILTAEDILRRMKAWEHLQRGWRLFVSKGLTEPFAWAEAFAEFEASLALDSEVAQTHNMIAWYYSEGPVNVRSPEKALPFALKAVELSNGHWNYVNTLGVVYYRLNQWTNAIDTVHQAIRVNESGAHGNDFFLLAMAYHQLGDPVRAEDFYNKGLQWQEMRSPTLNPAARREVEDFRREAAALLKK